MQVTESQVIEMTTAILNGMAANPCNANFASEPYTLTGVVQNVMVSVQQGITQSGNTIVSEVYRND